MKVSKFTMVSNISIKHDDSWNDDEIALLAKDILRGESLRHWDTKGVTYCSEIESFKKENIKKSKRT